MVQYEAIQLSTIPWNTRQALTTESRWLWDRERSQSSRVQSEEASQCHRGFGQVHPADFADRLAVSVWGGEEGMLGDRGLAARDDIVVLGSQITAVVLRRLRLPATGFKKDTNCSGTKYSKNTIEENGGVELLESPLTFSLLLSIDDFLLRLLLLALAVYDAQYLEEVCSSSEFTGVVPGGKIYKERKGSDHGTQEGRETPDSRNQDFAAARRLLPGTRTLLRHGYYTNTGIGALLRPGCYYDDDWDQDFAAARHDDRCCRNQAGGQATGEQWAGGELQTVS
ncbi:hypothetical protein EYF80_015752 [Liparis tanakae]|uniref:Uncharacterized protein n=1 Tax=Liparis tanakae TaxID=230148 RepID=A0A4Z2I8M5_9TELE|nr:hypothetical protein EYF80_015752 [Liparis tanakae]